MVGQREGREPMLIEPDYRGYWIEVHARLANGAWDAEIRVRRTFSEEKSYVEVVTCRTPTAQIAEERGVVYARRWVDRHADSRITGGRL